MPPTLLFQQQQFTLRFYFIFCNSKDSYTISIFMARDAEDTFTPSVIVLNTWVKDSTRYTRCKKTETPTSDCNKIRDFIFQVRGLCEYILSEHCSPHPDMRRVKEASPSLILPNIRIPGHPKLNPTHDGDQGRHEWRHGPTTDDHQQAESLQQVSKEINKVILETHATGLQCGLETLQ